MTAIGETTREPVPATVLIVDDAVTNRELVKAFLDGTEFRTVEAADGFQALQVIEHEPPDVILLDIMMPGLDGFEVCRRVKADARWQIIPVIMLTALNDVPDYVRAIECGAEDFLTKPLDPVVLTTRLRSSVRSRRLQDEVLHLHQFRHEQVRMVAHDLNNYMGAIVGYVELIDQTPALPPKLRERIGKVLDATIEANRLLANFMAIEKAEAKGIAVNPTPTTWHEFVGEVVTRHEVMTRKRELTFAMRGPADAVCLCDRDLMARVVGNLIHNAAKFATRDTAIELEWRSEGPALVFTIANHGPTIPEDIQSRIFERFFQVETKPELARGGTGLGLAFAKLAIEAQGGEISVRSPAPGWTDGVQFEIRLRRELDCDVPAPAAVCAPG